MGSAHSAVYEAEKCVVAHQRMIKDISLKVIRLEKAMESDDIAEILASARDLKQNLDFSGHSPRNDHTFPTELTAVLLQRFGGKPSV
ncbi:unnamed protein product [Thlaspi arvense]|uniref:Uncharacterized protein n=1 Tax=Thlaspi arvense TaxID=13288 RepID=A0AAU9SCR1_THLAR|nr:unnamed protein product [Thlaspi arvense]